MVTPREGHRSWRARALSRGPDPVVVVDLLQNAKAALAGVLAWVVALDVLGLEQPFLAPWAAVLVVHATVYRTVSRGGQQVAATFAGVFLAWACGAVFGVDPLGMGVMLVVSFLLGRHRWLRDEATTVATTGIVVLATNSIGQSNLLASRLVDTTVGIAVGLLVNLLVWPPLRDRAAWARADELPQDLADVLAEMSAGMSPDLEPADTEPWISRLRRLDTRIDEAWRLLGQARESGRFNLRRSRPAGLDDLTRTLHLLEQAVADALSMARTLATSAEHATLWSEEFRAPWKRLLGEAAEAISAHDTERLDAIRVQLGELAESLSTDSLPGSAWYEYGGLLVNLRNVVGAFITVGEWSRGSASSPRRSTRGPRLRRRVPGYSGGDDSAS
ncbi:MAG: hypothetical protein JWR90_1336 [Marmoricola sp.]|jgi:uncharacterized membrane protein YgaE (UPF0421/DUF939 family)|nr:hypothetical protein [Marmoricola sp.]